MMTPRQLAHEAQEFDDRQWREFLVELAKVRREHDESSAGESPEDASRDNVAAWVARQHLSADPGITDIWYLPTEAPQDEIRLIEVNTLLSGVVDDDITPIDFGFDVEGLRFRLLVADVAPGQWERLQHGELKLPQHWTLRGAQHFGLKA